MNMQGRIDLPGNGEGELAIVFTGDLCPVNRIETLCREGNAASVYDKKAIELMQDADIRITNLECPLTDKANPVPKAGPNLMAHPDCVEILSQGGFNVATLANNHIMDQGTEGLFHTIDVCKQRGIQTLGAGNNLREAAQPLVLNIKGIRIAILNVAEKEFGVARHNRPGYNPLDPVRNFHQIKAAKQKADLLFLVIHGGNEHTAVPNPRIVDTYRFFADLGVTAIIGHHTHFASGWELFKGVPIFYNLGNFLFDYRVRSDFYHWHEGYFLVVYANKNGVTGVEMHPYVQCRGNVGLQMLQNEEKTRFLNKIDEYSNIIKDDFLLLKHWEDYCRQKHIYYLSNAFRLNKLQRLLLRKGMFFKSKKNKKFLLHLFNTYHCDAHRDVMVDVLQSEIDQLK